MFWKKKTEKKKKKKETKQNPGQPSPRPGGLRAEAHSLPGLPVFSPLRPLSPFLLTDTRDPLVSDRLLLPS